MTEARESAKAQKHQVELEQLKWGYRKQELRYLEAGQHLRSLNQLMWQVPGMAIAITGGLWYGATTVDSDVPRIWVFLFAGIVDVLTIVILWRLRALIQIQIDYQLAFEGMEKQDGWKRTVIVSWTIALLAAALVSLVGALHPGALAKRPEPETSILPACKVTITQAQPVPASPDKPQKPRNSPQTKTPCVQ